MVVSNSYIYMKRPCSSSHTPPEVTEDHKAAKASMAAIANRLLPSTCVL